MKSILSTCNSSLRENWTNLIIFLYINTYFFDDITRYKHAISILLFISALYLIFKTKNNVLKLFNNYLFFSLLVFILSIFYTLLISYNINITLNFIYKNVFEKMLLVIFAIPILLQNKTKQNIERLFFISFSFLFFTLTLKELIQYYQEYIENIKILSTFNHRKISDCLMFLIPIFLFSIDLKDKKYIYFSILSIPILFFLSIATLQRGFWLAVIFVILLWFVLYRKPIVIISIITLFFCCVFLSKYTLKSDLLISKLTQTSSSARYGNGTQGAAWDLIKMNPIKGYGYGGGIYDEVYNKESIHHPEWIFKKSIGPHNVFLSVWFSSGIIGLISFLYFIFEIVKTLITNLKKESDNYIFKVSLAIFIGNILIMGLFEDINIMNIAIILGFSFSLMNKNS